MLNRVVSVTRKEAQETHSSLIFHPLLKHSSPTNAQTVRHCLSPTQPLFLQEFSTPTGLSLLTMSGFCAARPRLLMSSLLIQQAFPSQYLHWTALATLVDSLLLSLLHRLSSLRKPYGP